MATISVSKQKVEQANGMVILPIREYRRLLEQAMPAYRLVGADAKKLDKLVLSGIREHAHKKTKNISSLADLD